MKSLYLSGQQMAFRRTVRGMSGLAIHKALTARKLPDGAVYESKKFFSYLIKKYGL